MPRVTYKKLVHGRSATSPSSSGTCDSAEVDDEFYTLEDLADVQPSTYRSLKALLEYDPVAEGASVEDVFAMTFQISYDCFGEEATVDLVPGGPDVPVTEENKVAYVQAVVEASASLAQLTNVAIQDKPIRALDLYREAV